MDRRAVVCSFAFAMLAVGCSSGVSQDERLKSSYKRELFAGMTGVTTCDTVDVLLEARRK